MNRETLEWYSNKADEFLRSTSNADMTRMYERFLHFMPEPVRDEDDRVKIMDLGCGSGMASLYFKRNGYNVVPIDGCKEMCEATEKRTGLVVRELVFQDLDYTEEFDGIWACASLLHVPMDEMDHVLSLVNRALKDGGTAYASFKYGDGEREKGGRRFTDFTEVSLEKMLDKVEKLQILDLWCTEDVREDRSGERWVNVLWRKVG